MTIECDPTEAVVHWRERYELERKRSIERLVRLEELEWLEWLVAQTPGLERAWEQVDTLRRKIADWQILAGDIIANDHELDDNMRSRLRHYQATHSSHIH